MERTAATLTLVRHGETEGVSSIRLWGATDVALSEEGREQVRRAGLALEGERFTHAFTSPLGRARESAALVLRSRGPVPVVVDEFREINFGRWEGLTFEEVAERDPEGYAQWQRSELEFRFPDGDQRKEFRERVQGAGRRLLASAGENILLVVHTGVIRALLADLLGLDLAQERALVIGLGSIHRLRWQPEGWRPLTG